jgi:hypothetical protein
MRFRDDALKIVQVNYELTDHMGKVLQDELKVGILATSAKEALSQLRKIISKQCEIRINQIGDGGCIHIISDEVTSVLTGRVKNEKLKTETTTEEGENVRKAGRPPGSKNKPK